MNVMSSAAADKEIVRRFLLAIAAQDTATLHSVLAPEAHLTLMVAGVYSPQLKAFPQGIHWDRAGMVAMETQFRQRLAGPFALQIQSLIAEGDSVAAEVIGKGTRATTGIPYIQHYSYHFQMSQGRIADIRLYQDTFHQWQVWSDQGPGVVPIYLRASPLADAILEPAAEPEPYRSPEDRIAANKMSVRRFLNSIHHGDPETAIATWFPNGIWSFAIGGDYSPELRAFEGAPRWYPEGILRMAKGANKHPKEPVHLNIFSLIGEGDEVSAEAVGILVRTNGRAYRQHYSFHFKTHKGKLIEGHVYQDTLHQYDVTLDPPDGGPVAVRPSAV